MKKTERKIKELLGEFVDVGYEFTEENEIILLLDRLLKSGLQFDSGLSTLKNFNGCFKSNIDKGNYILATAEVGNYAIFRPEKMHIKLHNLDGYVQAFNFIVRIELKPIQPLFSEIEECGCINYEVVHKAIGFAQHQIKKATLGDYKISYTAGYGDTVYRLLGGELELIIGE